MPKNKMVMLGAIDVLCGYCSTVMSTLFSVLIPMLQFSSSSVCLCPATHRRRQKTVHWVSPQHIHFYLTYKVKHYKSTLEKVHRLIFCTISLFIRSSEQ